jgi:branched-chain amino acid transport system substrate-binding protein
MKKLLLAAILLVGSAVQAQTIKVGVYGPFSGGSAGMGISMRNGAQLAAEEINKAGGVQGKKIAIVARDDEARNEKGAQIMQELLEKENVLGPINTGVADASSRYAEEKHVPLIINASAGAKVNELFAQYPDNYVFRIAAGDLLQTELIVKEAVDGRKYKKVALLCDDTNYGQNGRAKMEKALEKRGVKPVYIGKFKIKDTDMTAQLQEAKAAGAEAVLLYGMEGRHDRRVDPVDERLHLQRRQERRRRDHAADLHRRGRHRQGQEVRRGVREGVPREADLRRRRRRAGLRLDEAARDGHRAGGLHRRSQNQGGAGKPYDGITGRYAPPFTPKDHEAVKETNVVMGVVKDGKVVPPAAAATAKK